MFRLFKISLKYTLKSKKFRIIFCSVAAAAAITAFVLVNFVFDDLISIGSHAAVCSSGIKTVFYVGGDTVTVNDDSASGFVYSEKSKSVFYTVNSSFSPGTYDIYFVKKGDKAPSLIDYGTTGSFSVSSDGKKVYYVKNDPSIKNTVGCYAQPGAGKTKVFAKSVKEVHCDGKNGVWFTRALGKGTALLSYSFETAAETEISANIGDLRVFESAAGNELVFETPIESSSHFTLNIVYPGERPVLICDDAVTVDLDDYTAGGNLYYYTLAGEGNTWRQVISDSTFESDQKMTEPKQENYVSFFGLSPGYEQDKVKFEEKSGRDKLRAALDDGFEKSGVSAPIYDAYVYNKSGETLMAANIDPGKISTKAKVGDPKIVYSGSMLKKGAVDVCDLYEDFAADGIEKAFETAENAILKNSSLMPAVIFVKFADSVCGYKTSGYPTGSVFEFSEDCKTVFGFFNENGITTAYFSGFSETLEPQKASKIDDGITDYSVYGSDLVYSKNDDDPETGELIIFADGLKSAIGSHSDAFLARPEGRVYSFKTASSAKDQSGVADLFCCDGKEKLLLTHVDIESVTTGSRGACAMIASANGENSLFICSGKAAKKISRADKILYFK